MNDDTDKPLNPVGDDALEARITAWVLGEASSFEAGELEKLCAADPALRLFERRLRVLHGLVAEDFKTGPAAEWKLSDVRRRKITDLLGVEPEVAEEPKHPDRFGRHVLLALAACLMIGVVSYALTGSLGTSAKVKDVGTIVSYSKAPEDRSDRASELRKQLEEPSLSDARKQHIHREYQELAEGGRMRQAAAVESESAVPSVPASPRVVGVARLESEVAKPARPAALAGNKAESEVLAKRKAAGGSAMDPPAEAALEFASRSQVDLIPPAEGSTIPAPLAAPASTATGSLTTGNRSDDGAITRNSIDAILNNPSREAKQEAAGEGGAALTGIGSDKGLAGGLGSGRVDAATFGDPDGMASRAEESNSQQSGLYLNSSMKDQKAAGAADLADLARKEEEAQPSSEAAASGWFGRSVADLTKGLKDVDAPGAASVDPLAEAPLLSGEPLSGMKRDLDLAGAPADGEGGASGGMLEKVDKAWKEPVTPEAKKQAALSLMSEVASADEPFSTFSLHVSDASFKLAQAAMERGEVPAAEGIRPEEFYNAFDYGDPAPASGEPVVCVTEQSAHPAFAQRNLLRIGVRTGSQGRGASTPLNLTLLLDHSGSMEREDRNAGLAMAVRQLSGLLKEGDTITVAGFSRQPRLLADRLPGARAQELNELIERTPSEGGTNLEEGLKLGEELAKRQFNSAAQNRVVLFTDGAANLGDARPEALQAPIEGLRQQGIAFDAAGFGADGLNDKLLERLTRNGNGRYYIVDGPEDADAGFAKQLAGAFRPAAENLKVQVRFNPARVAKYKLIGFEEHRLKKEDFRNDAVDAAEMAAEEAGNALYQIETLPQGEGEVGEVSVRFRDVASGQMVERTWTIPYDAQAPAFDKAPPSIQLAGLAAFTAEKLRAAPMADAVDLQQLGQVYAGVRARYPNSQPVADLGSMIGKMK